MIIPRGSRLTMPVVDFLPPCFHGLSAQSMDSGSCLHGVVSAGGVKGMQSGCLNPLGTTNTISVVAQRWRGGFGELLLHWLQNGPRPGIARGGHAQGIARGDHAQGSRGGTTPRGDTPIRDRVCVCVSPVRHGGKVGPGTTVVDAGLCGCVQRLPTVM